MGILDPKPISAAAIAAQVANPASVIGSQLTATIDTRTRVAVMVRDYGTNGAAIQSALDVAGAGAAGGVVWADPITYLATSTLSIPANVTLKGVPGQTEILVTIAPYALTNSGANAAVEGMSILRGANTFMMVCDISAYDNLAFRDCTFDGGGYANAMSGFRYGTAHGTQAGLRFERCTFTRLHYGIFSENISRATVKGVAFIDCVFQGNSGTDLEINTPNGVTDGVLIQGCTFTANTGNGITSGWGVGLANASNVIVADNAFDGYINEAIHIEDWSRHVNVARNTFRNCARNGRAYINILDGCRWVTVEANEIDATANTVQAWAIRSVAGGALSTATATSAITVGTGRTLTFNNVSNAFSLPVGGKVTTGSSVFTATAPMNAGANSVTGTLTGADITLGATLTARVTPGGRDSTTPENAPQMVRVAKNNIDCGAWCDGIRVELSINSTIEGNTVIGAGLLTAAYTFTVARDSEGVSMPATLNATYPTWGYGNRVAGNTIRGFRRAVGHFNGSACFGHGAIIEGNNVAHCYFGVYAVNAMAAVISGNSIHKVVVPLVAGEGPATLGGGYPAVITGNHAYACTEPMLIHGLVSVTTSSAVTAGTAVTVPLSGAIRLGIPAGSRALFTTGGVLTITDPAAVGATSIKGNLVGNVGSGETSTIPVAQSSTASENQTIVAGNGDSAGAARYSTTEKAPIATSTGERKVTPSDGVILTSGTTVILPFPGGVQVGRVFTVKNTSAAGTCTVTAIGATIDGTASATLATKAFARYLCDGTNYWVL